MMMKDISLVREATFHGKSIGATIHSRLPIILTPETDLIIGYMPFHDLIISSSIQ